VALWIAFTAQLLAADTMSAAASASPSTPVALTTESDHGLGFALTQELMARGWHVIATCRAPERAAELKAFAAAHPGLTIEKFDVADIAAIDALINNAGIAGDFGTAQGSVAIDPEEFQRVLRVNTYAPLRWSRAFLAQVAASRQQKIVSISSGLGSFTRAPDFMQYAPAHSYASSKGGLTMAMRMLATELKPRGGVLVGLVTPGMVDTAMQAQFRAASAGTPITAPVVAPADGVHGLVD
jgi:NAD(P)-dependent dehydrogenase (short-subunit alcohol dehydrogenase family)